LHPDVLVNFIGETSAKLLVNGNEVLLTVSGGLLKVEESL